MTNYTPPVMEEPHWHPVYRANALLREALQSTAQSFEALERHYSVETLSQAIESVLQGSVQITYPRPLAVRLDNLHIEEKKIPGLEALMRPIQHAPGAPQDELRGGADLADAEAEVWRDAPDEGWDDAELALADIPPLRADLPLDPELKPRQVHMRTLMGEFQRRQRSASVLVTVSVAAAVLLTVGGFVLAATLASPAGAGPLEPPRSTSIAWTKPASVTPSAALDAAASANRATKAAQRPARSAATTAPGLSPRVILAPGGRQIALGSLLPPSLAGYLMIRGLPPEAVLSAGRQSGGGAWLVKGEHVSGLTLTLGAAASGDYPVEVYVLESGDGPQARRSFVLRVAPSDRAPVATATPVAAVPNSAVAEEPAVPAAPGVLRERAMQLLGEGDIAAARMLLLHLAERGDGQAAYDLARTFDGEMLAELGAKGVGGDPAQARDWYERASQDGNAKAAERLKVLASLSGSGPAD